MSLTQGHCALLLEGNEAATKGWAPPSGRWIEGDRNYIQSNEVYIICGYSMV
jgi:hypothetical protein